MLIIVRSLTYFNQQKKIRKRNKFASQIFSNQLLASPINASTMRSGTYGILKVAVYIPPNSGVRLRFVLSKWTIGTMEHFSELSKRLFS
jgi:hypothetical protein